MNSIFHRSKVLEAITIFILVFAVSYLVLSIIELKPSSVKTNLIQFWCELRNVDPSSCYELFNSQHVLITQSFSLSLFITVIALTVISMKLRYFASFFAIFSLVFLGVVPPQELISGVEWRLILFLIGSMVLAYILRSLGVFRYIVLKILSISRGSPLVFTTILALISWFLAIAIDEATSIVYITMLLLDLKKLTGKNITPLLVFAVLATNTGSMSMPIGNPIGIYLAFKTGLHAVDFLVKALPLSLLTLLALVITTLILLNKYLIEIVHTITHEKINILYTEFYTKVHKRGEISVLYGLILLISFLILVSTSSFLAKYLSIIFEYDIEPHSLVSFIPYIFIFLSLVVYSPERLESALIHGVEWPSLFFFIALFMLGHSLLWSGVSLKIAYLITNILPHVSELYVYVTMLLTTCITSAFLDNLSVVVAYTSIASILTKTGVSTQIYWSLLYGATLGGNFTPIGSTANIVAISLCEKEKIKITWNNWLKIALLPTLLQVIIACTWLFIQK